MMGKKKKEEPVAEENDNVKDTSPDQQEQKSTPPLSAEEKETDTPEWQLKYSELNDKYLRLYSDFDNYRKRTLKEKLELGKFATEELIVKLLPILDDFDRALNAFETVQGADASLKDGTLLIFNKFIAILNQQGLEQMRVLGEPFDTDFHEAITNIPAPEPEQKGTVMDVVQKGYLLNGKVVRYAKVVVGS
jgi:molecular chaperone GrpE